MPERNEVRLEMLLTRVYFGIECKLYREIQLKFKDKKRHILKT